MATELVACPPITLVRLSGSECQARLRALVILRAQTAIPHDPAVSPSVDDIHHPPTSATPQQPGQQALAAAASLSVFRGSVCPDLFPSLRHEQGRQLGAV